MHTYTNRQIHSEFANTEQPYLTSKMKWVNLALLINFDCTQVLKISSTHQCKDYNVCLYSPYFPWHCPMGIHVYRWFSDQPHWLHPVVHVLASAAFPPCLPPWFPSQPLESHHYPVGVERRHLSDSWSFSHLASPQLKVLSLIKIHRSSRLSIFKRGDALILSELAIYALLMADSPMGKSWKAGSSPSL